MVSKKTDLFLRIIILISSIALCVMGVFSFLDEQAFEPALMFTLVVLILSLLSIRVWRSKDKTV